MLLEWAEVGHIRLSLSVHLSRMLTESVLSSMNKLQNVGLTSSLPAGQSRSLHWKGATEFNVLSPEIRADFIKRTHRNYYVSQPSNKPSLNCFDVSFLSLGPLICHLSSHGSALYLALTSLNSRPPSVFIYILTYYREAALHREVINFWPTMCQLLDNSNYILMSEKLGVKWLRCSWIGAKPLEKPIVTTRAGSNVHLHLHTLCRRGWFMKSVLSDFHVLEKWLKRNV